MLVTLLVVKELVVAELVVEVEVVICSRLALLLGPTGEVYISML